MRKNNMKKIMAQRFVDARKIAKLSQEEVKEKMGFNDRQTISNIESGNRQLSADELLRACTIFNKDIDFFTDPYISNENITWRALENNTNLNECESYVKRIIAANIHFSEILGESFYPLDIMIHKNNLSYDGVRVVAENIVEKLNFGEYPANNLYDKIQDKLNIDILYIDCPHDISGGACKTDKINFIFVNQNEVSFRRNFTIGHELFHILTWDTLTPERIDPIHDHQNDRKGKSKIESLADSFTSSFLMPKKTILKLWNSKGSKDINAWLLKSAEKLEVSGEALFWRAVYLGLVDKLLFNNFKLSYTPRNRERINLFNNRFVEKIYKVLEYGLVSLKKMVEVINMTLEKIFELLSSYNLKLSYEI